MQPEHILHFCNFRAKYWSQILSKTGSKTQRAYVHFHQCHSVNLPEKKMIDDRNKNATRNGSLSSVYDQSLAKTGKIVQRTFVIQFPMTSQG